MYLYQTTHGLQQLFSILVNKLADSKFEVSSATPEPAYKAVKDSNGVIVSYEALPVEEPEVTLDDLLILRNKLTEPYTRMSGLTLTQDQNVAIARLEAALRLGRPIQYVHVDIVNNIGRRRRI